MIKIAITGKANSGKDTLSKLLIKELFKGNSKKNIHFMAFANPVKEMARLAFPDLPYKFFYGPSQFRSEIIPNAFKDGKPLTVRQLLIDIGNDFGRKYNPNIWVENFESTFNKLQTAKAIVITDCRFRNEFDKLKQLGFYQIKLLRDSHTKINDVSESEQESIKNSEYNLVIHNNGSLNELKDQIKNISISIF